MAYKMKGWSGYQNSPAKQTCPVYTDEEKKTMQDKVNAQIEGTYVKTDKDIKRRKEDIRRDSPRKKTPTKQLKNPHWYRVNGKKVTYVDYKKAWKEGIDNRRPNLQTNDPDPFGLKAQRAKDREKLRKPTVLTEQQTKNLKNK